MSRPLQNKYYCKVKAVGRGQQEPKQRRPAGGHARPPCACGNPSDCVLPGGSVGNARDRLDLAFVAHLLHGTDILGPPVVPYVLDLGGSVLRDRLEPLNVV